MNKAVLHICVLFLMLSLANSAAADNTELWDLYPSGVEFSQYNGDFLSSSARANWFTFVAGADALNGVSLALTVEDGEQKVTVESQDAILLKVAAGVDWQWGEIFTDGFVVGDCEFKFAVELGTVLLPAPEGYRFAQRETLSWGGPPAACQQTVQSYVSKASNEAVMPLHVADWWSVGSLVKPTNSGRLEFVLIQELRRSKRLLPFDKTMDVEADPFRNKLRLPGTTEDRFALIQARLGNIMFADSFE